MNLTQLEYFCCAAEQNSFTEASKLLFVTRQAVAKAVSTLEKDLNLKLFTKTDNNLLSLTKEGSLIAEYASEIVYSCKDLHSYARCLYPQSADTATPGGLFSLAIATSPYEGSVFPATVLEDFSIKYPMITLTSIHCPNTSGLIDLIEGEVDAAIILGRRTEEGYCCAKLFDCIIQIAVSCLHPLANKKTVTSSELWDYPIAKPHDIKCCSPQIISLLEAGHTSQFIDVSSTTQAYIDCE